MASSPSDTSDLYSILGLERSATDAQIKKAYRANALKWHPDKVAASKRDEAGDRFKRIKEAYEVLIDGDRRKVYDQYGAASLEPGFHAPPEATAEPPYPQSPVYDTPPSQAQPQEPSYPTASYPATPLNPAYYSFTQSTFPDSYPSFPYFNGVPPGTYGVPFTRTFIYDSFGNAFPFGQPMPVPQPPSMPPQNPQPGMYFTPTPANPMRFPSPHPHGNVGAGMPFGPQPVPQPPSYSTPVQSPQPQYQYSNGDYFAANRQNWMPSNPAAESPSRTPQNGSREGTPTPQAMPPRWIPQPPPQPQPPSGQRWMPQPPPQPPPGPTSLPRPPRPPQSAFPQQVPPPSYPHHPSVYPQQYMQSPPQTPPQGPNNLSQPASPIPHLPERQWQSASQNSENPQVRPRRSSVNRLKRRSTTSDLRAYLAGQSVERGDRNSDRGKPGWRWKWPFG